VRPAPSHPAPGPHTGCPKFSVFRNLGSIFLKTKVLTIEPSLQRFENRQFPPNTPGGSGGVHLGPSRRDRVRIAKGGARGTPPPPTPPSWRDGGAPRAEESVLRNDRHRKQDTESGVALLQREVGQFQRPERARSVPAHSPSSQRPESESAIIGFGSIP